MPQAQGAIRFPWRLFSRIVLLQLLLILAALALSAFAAHVFFRREYLAQAERQMRDTLTALAGDARLSPGWCSARAAGTELRFTVIEKNGKVLCDSRHDPSTMENHAGRPEVQAALQGRFTSDIRRSATLGEEMLYGAVQVGGSGRVLRAAIPLSYLSAALSWFDRSVAAAVLLLALVLALASAWAGRSLAFPIGRVIAKAEEALGSGGPGESVPGRRLGELSRLESSLDVIGKTLRDRTESLDIERAEHATLMSAISEGILAVDCEETPLFYNSRFATLFPRSALGSAARLPELIRAPEILGAFREALEQGRTGAARAVPFSENEGGKRYFSISVSPLRGPGGGIYGAVGVFHDVTELKAAEQIRIDFVANVSHELRTPLASIKGYTDTLLQDSREGRPLEGGFLATISRNVDRLMALINDLLDLSSIESADVLQKSRLSTKEVTARALEQLRGRQEARGQRIDTRFDAEIVEADPKRVEQVLINLLDNAIKYTPPGARIEVSWEPARSDSGDPETLLRVQDNGPGIPVELQSRLFERFFRVDKARSREQGGTGLGLAIVKHIMQRHEGAVWVESAPGKGAAFVCRFPG